MHNCLPMGCLPSRSTAVSPIESSERATNLKARTTPTTNDHRRGMTTQKPPVVGQNGQTARKITANGHNLERTSKGNDTKVNNQNATTTGDRNQNINPNNQAGRQSSSDSLNDGAEDEIMSILMNDDEDDDQENAKDELRRQQEANDSKKMGPRGCDGPSANGGNDKLGEPSDESLDATNDNRQMETENHETTSRAENGVVATLNSNNALVPMDSAGTNLNQQLQTLNQHRGSITENENSASFDEELNADILRQYIIVDFEITQLEDKDALRIYHEKIEQLEQLERELDMISTEAEEVAARSETNTQLGFQSPGDFNNKADGESNSLLSGATESMSPRSSFRRANNNGGQQQQRQLQIENGKSKQGAAAGKRANANGRQLSMFKQPGNVVNSASNSIINNGNNNSTNTDIAAMNASNSNNNNSYSSVEEVFNRKIILEKERDKLKKEVEMVIIECDKLQNRYKKRDEILDKLFDGRTGNGLENHLEQQLNWLMEQKHYVDQVFYAWKRAETLTSQTCEQFASALELLKRMPMIQDDSQRAELTRSIGQLLIKSRQDMEQAQRYNPNVDAPFFTDTETERFDKIIETISSRSINQGDYNQIATVIQFAHKRAVSIRLWLEQILQITIARDSFELAEEYKWIAIQLRKERITLIKSKLQDAPYRSMAQSIHEQLLRQQQQQQQQLSITNTDSANNTLRASRVKSQQLNQLQPQQQQQTATVTNEVNRDSGIESDDIDIEEEIYRLLEMNKTRLEAAIAASSGQQQQANSNNIENNYKLKPIVNGQMQPNGSGNGGSGGARAQMNDQAMRERIERRVRGEQQLAIANGLQQQPIDLEGAERSGKQRQEANGSIGTTNSQMSASHCATPSKLRVELDEATRQKLLRQVDQSHEKHRSRMESLRGNNKAKASDLVMSRMQQARKYQEASQLEKEKS